MSVTPRSIEPAGKSLGGVGIPHRRISMIRSPLASRTMGSNEAWEYQLTKAIPAELARVASSKRW
jgi:hypothetical protein